jgi:hypothetical protein
MNDKTPQRLPISAANRPVEVISYWKSTGGLLLNPPYQRGDVWGKIRQRNLIRSVIIGIPIPAIIINDRARAGWDELIDCAVIDGKQRMTAILDFLESKLEVPACWFGLGDGNMLFKDLPIGRQRCFRSIPIPFAEGQLESLEAEQEVFELVNFGGVPQGESDF